jgi:hypothetical protein
MIEVVSRPWPDPSLYDDLPAYLTEPTPARTRDFRHLAESWSKTRQRAVGPAGASAGPGVPFGGRTPGLSPVFARMVTLRRGPLGAALDAWWTAAANAGVVTVHHRLQLGRPEGTATAGWTMKGRVRRLTTLHWVPVVVELWPAYEAFTRITMTPQVHVFASRRYFRLGHLVLDRLWAELDRTG